jgi:uncharacterized protein (TIGR00251 family)
LVKIGETKEGVVMDVYVKPRSREFRVVLEGDDIVIHCSGEPVDGRVNRELVKELSRLLGKRVELISGFSSRQKKLLVKDANGDELERVLMGV